MYTVLDLGKTKCTVILLDAITAVVACVAAFSSPPVPFFSSPFQTLGKPATQTTAVINVDVLISNVLLLGSWIPG